MFRVFRCLVCMLSLRAVPGWWDQKQPPTEKHPSWRSDPKGFAWWVYNETIHGNHTFDDLFTWAPTSWDGWIWTFFDVIFSTVGWLIFVGAIGRKFEVAFRFCCAWEHYYWSAYRSIISWLCVGPLYRYWSGACLLWFG